MSSRIIGPIFAAMGILACTTTVEPTPADDTRGACQAIGVCHGTAGSIAEECHDLAHAGDDVACGKRKSECLAACPTIPKVDSGAVADAGDAGPPAPTAECRAYCTCMGTTCKGKPKYPFLDDAGCLAGCAAFSAAERKCFAGFCASASTAAGSHDCEHAGGALGLVECPP